MEYKIDDIVYEVVIVKKRNKNTYIRMKEDMKIYVTTNFLATKSYIKRLLDDNYEYLKKMINQMCKKNEKKELFFYLGSSYDIIFISTISNVDIDYDNRIIYAKDEKMLNKWYTKTIKDTFSKHYVDIFEEFEEVKVIPKLRIIKMKNIWGVYNIVSNTVTLNSELMKYSSSALDYVIVHELSHVIFFDHSKNFWNLVSKYCSNYKSIKKELKE